MAAVHHSFHVVITLAINADMFDGVAVCGAIEVGLETDSY